MNKLNIIIITGLSGSGKSTAMSALEDAGYYCVDNMPVLLFPKFLDLPLKSTPGILGLGFVMDLREKEFISTYPSVFNDLTHKGYAFKIIFLEADENVLIRRFSQTRRQHPLNSGSKLVDSIRKERGLLSGLRKLADKIIDTSQYDVHNLKSVIKSIAEKSVNSDSIRINIMSFGFKYGIPQDSDLVMDVRFLQNPFFVPELKPFSGLNQDVRRYVLENKDAPQFLGHFLTLIDYLIPLYKREGKSYLTLSVGCTGGRHRSVAVADTLYEHIRKMEANVTITHRDIGMEEPSESAL
ncbi:MAG: RNase adapter RapZ [Proteobacteria bacterium]|nr:RNase adapter RapZ [Pseudomonadota bacterium]